METKLRILEDRKLEIHHDAFKVTLKKYKTRKKTGLDDIYGSWF